MTTFDYAVVGGGIIGLATAYKLLEQYPTAGVIVFEKEAKVGQHQSGHNSGVLHAGLYYKPGSLKARLAVSGIRKMTQFCIDNSIPHEICGKLVVATSDEEVERLKELLSRGQKNGLSGLRWMSPDEMRQIEPNVAGVAAVHVPEEGIVDYPAVCDALQRHIEAHGGQVRTGHRVDALDRTNQAWTIGTPQGQFQARYLINCGGLHCDRILGMSGLARQTRIVPVRGEYYSLNAEGAKLVRNLIYPVPNPAFPFLGVHYTRMIHGGVEAGPNAVLATKREGYTKTAFSLGDVWDTFSFPGFWKFMAKYPSMTAYELKRSFSRAEFTRSLQKLVPAVQESHLGTGGAGVRAQAIAVDGTMVQDFEIVRSEGAMHVVNAPSPGATASLAIAEHLLTQIT
ncbi:hydroxyglutarate oxidase [Bryobacterales bacterium F-183]|nr:hydroxyglutarate oxidase [Bryobacterales bacterium F-183]